MLHILLTRFPHAGSPRRKPPLDRHPTLYPSARGRSVDLRGAVHVPTNQITPFWHKDAWKAVGRPARRTYLQMRKTMPAGLTGAASQRCSANLYSTDGRRMECDELPSSSLHSTQKIYASAAMQKLTSCGKQHGETVGP